MDRLFIVTYSLTQLCNLNCKHCYSSAGIKGEQEFLPDMAREVIRQIADAGSRIIVLDGGEPLMRKDIFELISYAKNLGLITVLGTNGTLLTHKVIQKLVDSRLDHCAVSLDGATAKTHEWLRGVKGCFEKAVRGAKLIQNTGIQLQINTCLHSRNQHELNDIVKLAESLNARSLQLFFYARTGRCSPEVEPPVLQKGIFDNIKSKVELRVIGDMTFKGSKCCSAGDKVCCILNDGTVLPCMLLPLPLGNIRNHSLKEIWASPLTRNINEKRIGILAGRELCKFWV